MEYGVNVSNKFAFLSGDEDVQDPDDLIARAEQQAKKEKASVLKKDNKKSVIEKKVTISTAVNSVSNKENVDFRRPLKKDSFGPRQGGRGPRINNYRRSDENTENDDATRVGGENRVRNFNNRFSLKEGQQNREGGGRFNNYNNGERGSSRRFNGLKSPRTENSDNATDNHVNNHVDENRNNRFRRNQPRSDRISGSDKTGVRSIPKKDGFGRGNWGNENDELETNGEIETNGDSFLNHVADPVDNVNENNEQVEPVPEPPREFTLEEWKAKQKSEAPKFNVRKPGEGSDKKIYQKLVPIKRSEENNKNSEQDEEEIQVKQPREKALNIEVSFHDPQRNRGGRGFRDDRRADGIREDRRNGNFNNSGVGSSQGASNSFRGGRRGGGGGGRNQSNGTQFNLAAESFPALGSR